MPEAEPAELLRLQAHRAEVGSRWAAVTALALSLNSSPWLLMAQLQQPRCAQLALHTLPLVRLQQLSHERPARR